MFGTMLEAIVAGCPCVPDEVAGKHLGGAAKPLSFAKERLNGDFPMVCIPSLWQRGALWARLGAIFPFGWFHSRAYPFIVIIGLDPIIQEGWFPLPLATGRP
jgi:hypothetical protein